MNAPLTAFSKIEPVSKFQDAPSSRPLLGQILLEKGAISDQTLHQAIELQSGQDVALGKILTAQGTVSSQKILQALAQQTATTCVNLEKEPPDPRLMHLVDPIDCLNIGFIPWRVRGGALIIAMVRADLRETILRKLPAGVGPVHFILADNDQIQTCLHKSQGIQLIAHAETRTPQIASCRGWSTRRMQIATLILIVAMGLFLFMSPAMFLASTFALAVVVLALNTALKTVCVIIALVKQNAPKYDQVAQKKMPKISILVPLFHEENIASALVMRLARLNYPPQLLELCLVIEADDTITRKAIKAAPLPPWLRVIQVPAGQLKTKPRAMNYALNFTSGRIIGIYDAEDAPDPDQLQHVVRHFQSSGPDLACVQGILSFYNGHKNWLSRCFAFEYAGWFRVMLPGLQRLGFAIPLGGTTLFFRRDALIELGAWDAHNVTEDADLGMRLARHGYRCEMMQTVTQEEANSRIWPWVKQRSRWLKGYALTWCVHMRSPRKLWRDLGAWKFFGFQLLFLGTLAAFFLAPFLWLNAVTFAFGLYNPAFETLGAELLNALTAFFVISEVITLSVFLLAATRLENRPAFLWIFTLPGYFIFGTIAAYKALVELAFKPFYWDKTAHGMFGGAEFDEALSAASAPLTGVDLQPGLESDGQVVAQGL